MLNIENNERCGNCRVKITFNNQKRKFLDGSKEYQVFSNFSFDANDRAVLEKRRAEALSLIKIGKYPDKKINGQVNFNIRSM